MKAKEVYQLDALPFQFYRIFLDSEENVGITTYETCKRVIVEM